jgi:AcrR family transcriptional regulator
MSRVTHGPIFSAPEALPRGPHALSRDQVAGSQRARLMAAIAELVGDEGYAAAKIGAVAKRAGVSPGTFYEHFEDKVDCFLATYDAFAAVLLERIAAVVDPDSDWDDFIHATLDAYLGTLEENPVVARAFLIEIDAAGPAARRRRREAFEQFAALIKVRHEAIRAQDPALGPVPDRIYLALVLGIRELVADALEQSERPRLRELAPDIVFWADALIRGAAPAAEALAREARKNPAA